MIRLIGFLFFASSIVLAAESTLPAEPLSVEEVPLVGVAQISDQARFLNLAQLYNDGLTGAGETCAVVDPNPFSREAPGLAGAFLEPTFFSTEPFPIDSHSDRVSQVLAGELHQGRYLGIAPEAKIHGLVCQPQQISSANQLFSVYEDLMRPFVSGPSQVSCFCTPLRPNTAKAAILKMSLGLSLALKNNIPVFQSGGNDGERFPLEGWLNETKPIVQIGHPLLFVVGGYEITSEDGVVDRDTLIMSPNSAYCANSEGARNFVVAPYTFPALTRVDLEAVLKQIEQVKVYKSNKVRALALCERLEKFKPEEESSFYEQQVKEELVKTERLEHELDEFSKQAKLLMLPVDSVIAKGKEIILADEARAIREFTFFPRDGYQELSVSEQCAAIIEQEIGCLESAKAADDLSEIEALTTRLQAAAKAIKTTPVYKAKNTSGTSFSAPSAAGVFLLLKEYSNILSSRYGCLLDVYDIAAAMRAGAYMPRRLADSDKIKFGAGIIDGENSRRLLESVARAKSIVTADKHALNAWTDIVKSYGMYCKADYLAATFLLVKQLYPNKQEAKAELMAISGPFCVSEKTTKQSKRFQKFLDKELPILDISAIKTAEFGRSKKDFIKTALQCLFNKSE